MRPHVAPPPPPGLERGPVPSLSVIIPAYQAAGTIAQAVESALDQTVPAHEVIVCDDGSTDDLEGALAPYRDRMTLIHKENGGGASALNAAARAASGDFVVVLDSDDAYEPERLEALGALAAARPDLDVLMTDSHLEAGGRVVGRFSKETPFEQVAQREAILDRCFVGWPAIRRSRLIAVGGFDESLRIAYDWDCWLRLLFDGARAGLVDMPLHRYRIHEDSLSGARAPALRERVVVLEKADRQLELSDRERSALEQSLASKRRRAILAEAEAALRDGAPDARRRALRVAADSGLGMSARAKALLAALAPRLAARRLGEREAHTGYSVLRRSTPDG
jgi:GT2 family glycosyltransferase